MTETILKIRGVNPTLFRDGRPFTQEDGSLTAQTLPLPYPGTLAGFVRTFYGNQKDWDWEKDKDASVRAMQIQVHSPLVMRNEQIVFPAPADAVLFDDKRRMSLRPQMGETGCNLPEGLKPLSVTEDGKPMKNNRFWSHVGMMDWLEDADGNQSSLPECHGALPTEERTHVGIDRDTGTSKEGLLFTTHRLCFEEYNNKDHSVVDWAFLAKVSEAVDGGVGTLGGERGIGVVEEASAEEWHRCPDSLKVILSGSDKLRMVLATPAIFDGGWKPGWLNTQLEGTPPELDGVRLKLVSAACARREAVSGWDYQKKKPKAVRWLVPAGAVYFFEIISGDDSFDVAKAWLQPVSDGDQNRRDGYGLALWGVWNYAKTSKNECKTTEGEQK